MTTRNLSGIESADSHKEKDAKESSGVQVNPGKVDEPGNDFGPAYKQAFDQYKLAAGNGDYSAYVPLANMYWRGLGTGRNIEQAKKWLKKGANEDNLASILNLVYLFTKSDNITQGLKLAKTWLIKVYRYIAEPVEIKEYLENGKRDNLWGEDNRITDWFYEPAKSGNKDAIYCIIMLIQSDFVQPDDKIMDLLKDIADNGNTEAQYCLGEIYFHGKGVEEDYNKAEKYLLAAANGGLEEVYFELGNLYKNSLHDYPKALIYLNKALESGDIDANLQLGQMYELGLGVKEDWKKAEHYYKAAEAIGFLVPISECAIASLYEKGNADFPKDLEKARQHYQEAAKYRFNAAIEKLEELERFLNENIRNV